MARFPVHYQPRPYQAELHQMWRNKRIGVAVFPRQSGKDVAMSMEMCERRLKIPKSTGTYISLDNPMIKDILWQKTYVDPATGQYVRMLQDNVPSDRVDWKNTVMEGEFTNKSRLKVQGYFQSGRDKNGVGTSFLDYAFTELALFTREDPIPRLMPIIQGEHEDKKLMVASTPRGKRNNPLWQLIQNHGSQADFQVITRTIEDLNVMMSRAGLPAVMSQQRLEEVEETYFKRFGNNRMFMQEYYVDFDEMDAAAVYGEAYIKLLKEKRNAEFNLDGGHPVYVAFDIGSSGLHSDATAWIAFQWFNGKLFIFDCGEGHGKALPEYVDELQAKPWFNKLQMIILPWDGDHHEKAVNTTPADMMRTRFPNVAVLAKSNKVWKIPGSRQGDHDLITDIQQVRLQLYNTIIHPDNCVRVLECLERYRYEYNSKLQMWSGKPLHDQYSNMMDALRYTVQATKELDFFQGGWFDGNQTTKSRDYEEDWSGVWAR
ncbi:terminase [Microbacterium phage Hannabella]|uniref:Terminase n=1 Tax=Microbacterium phage Arete TaxID=2713257 RepID=A0A6G8R150_9CAUD|nr:terminase [Microbacterium phage Arete]QIN93930.1 terminase [Microbacterium phage Arete]URM86440.1 terminase [Microbacterium phage Gshelby23]UVG34253.1 terminase [Microbacterium phage Hannabella]